MHIETHIDNVIERVKDGLTLEEAIEDELIYSDDVMEIARWYLEDSELINLFYDFFIMIVMKNLRMRTSFRNKNSTLILIRVL